MITNLLNARKARCLTLIHFFCLTLSTPFVFAQVGINTSSPTAMLDVNGEMRIRTMTESFGNHILTADAQGMISKARSFLLYEANEIIAEDAVTRTITGSETESEINLQLEALVVVPANKEVKVIINYSVPMGTLPYSNPPNSYIGATFLKNGIEQPRGSRKFSILYNASGTLDQISNMGTITNTYIENFDAEAEERIIRYSIRGYIEQHASPGRDYDYRFNMWKKNGENFNWGKASINYQVYVK